MLSPAQKEHQRAKLKIFELDQKEVRREYRDLFASHAGQIVLQDLEAMFSDSTTLRVNKISGGTDPYASVAAAGGREVIIYIKRMMQND